MSLENREGKGIYILKLIYSLNSSLILRPAFFYIIYRAGDGEWRKMVIQMNAVLVAAKLNIPISAYSNNSTRTLAYMPCRDNLEREFN